MAKSNNNKRKTDNGDGTTDDPIDQSIHWAFTVFNYDDFLVERLRQLEANPDVQYLVVGKETTEDGKPHLQGHVSWKKKKRLKSSKKILVGGHPDCHLTVVRFLDQHIAYCKKEGDFFEIGEPPKEKKKQQGKRNDLEPFKKRVKELGGKADRAQLRDEFSGVASKYPQFFREFISDVAAAQAPVLEGELKPWQHDMKLKLDAPTDARTIVFVVDEVGNAGKTWFSHFYQQETKDKIVQILSPGKFADMAFNLHDCPDVVIIDIPKSKSEHLLYDFLEKVKDGYVFSCKYESRHKRFKSPHVVVMMNEEPNMDKLSADRYEVFRTADYD